MSYWDTSALAKLYVPEPDSASFHNQAALPNTTIVTARLTLWEMRRVALRKEAEAAIQLNGAETVWQKADADAEAGRLVVIDLERSLVGELERVMTACFRNSPPVAIRTLDAIHLASARVSGEKEIVLTDKRLREAAVLLGFTVFP